MIPVLPVPVGIRIKQGESKLLRWSIAKPRASAWCWQSLRFVAFDITSNICIHPRSHVHTALPANDEVLYVVASAERWVSAARGLLRVGCMRFIDRLSGFQLD
jgi:hypothetical protein